MNRLEIRTGQALALIAAAVGLLAMTGSMQAGTVILHTLHTFGGAGDGKYPDTGQLVAVGSVLYGDTFQGGASGNGTIFSINTDGTGYKILYSFAGADGALPEGIIVNGSTIYGTTQSGGANGTGTVFQINTDGTGFRRIYQFPSYNGQSLETPFGRPALVGSTLYGATVGLGAIFSVNTDGTDFKALFGTDHTDGGLVSSGTTIYGTSTQGGNNASGSVFSFGAGGVNYQTLESFPLAAPHNPIALPTIVGSRLYGTLSQGGLGGGVFGLNTDGTSYRLLHTFPNGVNLNMPVTLVGNRLFGVTESSVDGGTSWCTLFSMNSDGTSFQTLFDGPSLVTPGSLTLVGSTV